MKRRALLIMAMSVLLAAGALTTAANAEGRPGMAASSPAVQGGPPPQSDPAGEFMGRWHQRPTLEAMQRKLGITDEQKKQIRALYVGFRDRTRKARTDLIALKDEKKTMLLSGKIDQQRLAQIDDQEVKLVSDLMKERLKLRRDRLALLTPDQIERLADWKAEKAFRSKGRGMHRGHGHGWGG